MQMQINMRKYYAILHMKGVCKFPSKLQTEFTKTNNKDDCRLANELSKQDTNVRDVKLLKCACFRQAR